MRVVTWCCVRTGLAGLLALACAGVVRADTNEVEPNESKTQATPATLAPGGVIRGRTFGTSTTGAADSTYDYWKIKTAAAADAIYRYDLTLTTTTPGHVLSIRGRSQSGGVINAASDTTLQNAVTGTTPPRTLAWYGFGKQEEVYVRIGGATDTGMPPMPITSDDYVCTLARTPVVPVVVTSEVFQGQMEIRVNSVMGNIDTEFWIYDGNFNALVTNVPASSGAGGADENLVAGVPSTVLSSARRTLGPGVYYVAVGAYQFANNQPAAPGDFQSGQATDFANTLVSSIVNRASMAKVNVSMRDSLGNEAVSPDLDFAAGSIGVVQFVKFTVTNPTGPAMSMCTFTPPAARAGQQVTLKTVVTPGTSGAAITTVTADLTAFGLGNAVPLAPGMNNEYSVSFSVPSGQTLGTYSVDITAFDATPLVNLCTATMEVVPPGDECGSAAAIAQATSVSGTLVGATASPIAPQCSTASIDTYYRFTADETGTWVVRLTPTDFAALSLGTACPNFDGALFCRTISNVVTSSLPFALNAGDSVLIRVACFPGDEAPFMLRVDPVAAGACCSNVDGSCRLSESDACTNGVYQGSGTTCAANPCPAFGACCDNTNFVCSTRLQSECAAPLAFLGAATTCVPYPCTPQSNDSCAGAITLTSNGVAIHSTLAATGTGTTQCGTIYNDVWYRWTAPAAGTLRFAIEGNGPEHIEAYDGGTQGACSVPSGANYACAANLPGQWLELPVVAGHTQVFRAGQSVANSASVSGIDLWFVRSVTGSCCQATTCTMVSESECTGGTFTAGGLCHPLGSVVETYLGQSLPVVDFSDTTGATLSSQTITVADQFPVGDVEVFVGGTHSFVGDVVLSLEKDGRKIELFNRVGRSDTSTGGASSALPGADLGLTFSDAGASTLHAALAALDPLPARVPEGTYQPASMGGMVLKFKDVFNGVPAAGQWTLTVSDWARFDAGALSWTLKLRRGGSNVCATSSLGRCCVGSRCTVVNGQNDCTNGGSGLAGTVFTADVVQCNAPGNYVTPCCVADYNHFSGITIQDVFDFLTDWFNMDPDANVEGDGVALPTIQDVFDFLTAWFAGGC